ncbi:hypothetical protein A2U01_0055678, partial [Trifolium medium]|nr:hypothetical protein [Trifolium medium]
PAERLNRVGRDPSRVPQIEGDWGDWRDVMPRRRKASRQADASQDRQRWSSRHGGGQVQARFRGLSRTGYGFYDRYRGGSGVGYRDRSSS